jgi:prepilin-type N-terminal cleavage/methylation domain-containing protein
MHLDSRKGTQQGFSLVEGLVAMVVLSVALIGTTAAFNLITSSIGGTGSRNSANLAIDNDIAGIKQLAANYTSCVYPLGPVTSATGECSADISTSEYYFPEEPANWEVFLRSCRGDDVQHITVNLISAINARPAVAAGVVRQSAVREDVTDPKNHAIVVSYQGQGISRLVKVVPVVSAWCG